MSLSSALTYLIAGSLGVGAAAGAAFVALDGEARTEPQHYGGTGGVAASLSCPSDHSLVGARIYERDALVAGIVLLCREHGDQRAPLRETALLGNATEQATVVRCASDHAAVGIWGAAGRQVDQLSLSCAARALPSAPVEHLGGVGGRGGSGFHARCPGRMRGIAARAGELIDNVSLLCEDTDA